MSDTALKITIQLDYPITLGDGQKITQFTMRRAKAKDLRKIQAHKNEAEQEFLLFASLTNSTIEDIEELDLADYQKLQDAFKSMTSGKLA